MQKDNVPVLKFTSIVWNLPLDWGKLVVVGLAMPVWKEILSLEPRKECKNFECAQKDKQYAQNLPSLKGP